MAAACRCPGRDGLGQARGGRRQHLLADLSSSSGRTSEKTSGESARTGVAVLAGKKPIRSRCRRASASIKLGEAGVAGLRGVDHHLHEARLSW
jgi:hypothetical protein